MGLDIGVVSEDFTGAEDRRWLGAQLGTDVCRSITLDVSTFSAYHFTAKGAIPSGTALALYANGLYGPYKTAAADDAGGVAAGLLFNLTRVGPYFTQPPDLAAAADVGAPLYWMGIVKTAFLPTAAGTFGGGGNTDGVLDAAGRADLANFIRFE